MAHKNKFFSYLLLFLYLVFFIGAADYLFYLRYRRKILPPANIMSRSIPDNFTLFGSIQSDKESSPLKFDREKPRGVIRIGCFGDSFTHGDEVSSRHDYPTLLQGMLRRHGYRNVEVINFGIGGIGFHQAFNAWKYYGKAFDLDYVVLGPLGFLFERDCTFTNDWLNSAKESILEIKSRYILDNGGVKAIAPIGSSYKEIVTNYIRFLPFWRYLRYDLRAPAFIEAPIDFVAPGKRLKKNPFYYRRDMKREMRQICVNLLRSIAGETPQVVVFNFYPEIVEIAKEVKADNVYAFHVPWENGFPYKAFKGHCTPNGNERVAHYMFSYLTGMDAFNAMVLSFDDRGLEETKAGGHMPFRDLSKYARIFLEMNGERIGGFYDNTYQTWYAYCDTPDCLPAVNTFQDVRSLIALKTATSSLVDAVFVAVDFDLAQGQPVSLGVTWRGKTQTVPLGTLQCMESKINFGSFDFFGFTFNEGANAIVLPRQALLLPELARQEGAVVQLMVGGHAIIAAENHGADHQMRFICTNNYRYFMIREEGNRILDIDRLPAEGSVFLRLETSDATQPALIPISRWRKTERDHVRFNKSLKLPLKPLISQASK